MAERSAYSWVKNVAFEYDKKLLSTDFKGGTFVLVEMKDGSTFLFRDAFIRRAKEWLLVFTEHYGYHIYHPDECRKIFELEMSLSKDTYIGEDNE